MLFLIKDKTDICQLLKRRRIFYFFSFWFWRKRLFKKNKSSTHLVLSQNWPKLTKYGYNLLQIWYLSKSTKDREFQKELCFEYWSSKIYKKVLIQQTQNFPMRSNTRINNILYKNQTSFGGGICAHSLYERPLSLTTLPFSCCVISQPNKLVTVSIMS